MENLVQSLITILLPHLPQWKRKAILAQAIFETGNFSSKAFKVRNNLFGMKHPTKRKTLSVLGAGGEYGNDAHFATWAASIIDRYYLWEKQYPELEKQANAYDYMKAIQSKGYATSPTYLRNWYLIYNRL